MLTVQLLCSSTYIDSKYLINSLISIIKRSIQVFGNKCIEFISYYNINRFF